MKAITLSMLVIFMASAAFAQDVTVKSKSKLNTDFSKYKTFGWAKTDPTPPSDAGYDFYIYTEEYQVPVRKEKMVEGRPRTASPYMYSYNVIIPFEDEVTNSAAREAIEGELEGRGYRANEASPDLLIAYKVLDRPANIKGYISDKPVEVSGGREVRQPEDTTAYRVEPGTLIVSLIDARTSTVVWDGFASGMMDQQAFVTDDARLKEAIHLIFEEYRHRADNVRVR